MKHISVLLLTGLLSLPAGMALAQNADQAPNGSNVSQQFKNGFTGVGHGVVTGVNGVPQGVQHGAPSFGQHVSDGAQQVGYGFTQVGHGIKNGAILTWDAVKNGTSSAAHTISGN